MREYSSPAVAEISPAATLADVVFERAEREPRAVAMRRKDATASGAWRDVTTAEFRTDVAALAKGLIAAGIGPATGSPCCPGPGTSGRWPTTPSGRPARSPCRSTRRPVAEQVEWILGDSGARALIVETPAHLQANSEVLARLPGVERIWLIEGPDAEGQAAQLDSLAADGAGISDEELAGRRASRQAADLATIIYTSGTTGRPKGCELSHLNLLADVRNAIGGLPAIFAQPGRSALLFLPLAHSFARIIQIGCLESGTVLGYTADVAHLVDDLGTFQPTFILAVPRVFEKVYNGAEQQAAASAAKSRIFKAAAQSAVAWSKTLDVAGQPVPGQQSLRLRAEHALYDRLVYAKLRAATGGRVQYAVSGGAALGERLGHFFRGVGITVLEGYGLTETSPVISANRPDHNKIGTVGPPIPSVTVRIADDGEILASRAQRVRRLLAQRGGHQGAGRPRWLAAHRRPGRARRGRLPAGHRAEEGHHRHRGRQERGPGRAGGPAARASAGQPVHGGGRRAAVRGLPGHPGRGSPAGHGRPGTRTWPAPRWPNWPQAPELIAEIQSAVDDANKAVSRAESIRKFTVLPVNFTEQNGYLTPSLKVRRGVVAKDFAADIDALYS